ncbi:erg24, C-14 sterol reductase, partial [Ascosphaera atra]
MATKRRTQAKPKATPKQPSSAAAKLQEKPEYEFFGPPGAIFIIFILPLVVYSLAFFCNDVSGCPVPSLLSPRSLTLRQLKQEIGWPETGLSGLYDKDVTLKVLGYYLVLLILQVFLPGTTVEGVQLASGGKLKYKLN